MNKLELNWSLPNIYKYLDNLFWCWFMMYSLFNFLFIIIFTVYDIIYYNYRGRFPAWPGSQELRALLVNLAYVLDKTLISESYVWLKQNEWSQLLF